VNEPLLLSLPAKPLTVAQVVLLPSPAGLPESLTYLVPEALLGVIGPGMPALVPVGGREHLGYVLGVEQISEAPEGIRLKPIKSLPRTEAAFHVHTLELLRWIAKECHCSLADVMPLAVPERHGAELQSVITLGGWDGSVPERTGLLTRQTAESLYRALADAAGSLSRDQLEAAVKAPNLRQVLRKAKTEGWVTEEQVLLAPRVKARIVKAVRLAPDAAAPAKLSGRQGEVLDYLRSRGGEAVAQAEVAARLGVSPGVFATLARKGCVEETTLAIRRAPGGFGTERDVSPALTPFQGLAADGIHAAMNRGEGESILLFGVTGSGKTEVYLHAIQRARDAGRTAALLVPEISLTAQVAAAVRRRLGERVAILHSALSEGERFDELQRVRTGEADVVVGPRSALFAPLKDPALVILDEEHDGSYKQASTPRYHARSAAQALAHISGGCVVLGSATPSVETYYAAQQGSYGIYELPERIRQRPLPSVEVVDLKSETRQRPGSVFGRRLEESIRQRLAAGEQVILFLNRRGFSGFLLCRDCGDVPHCPNCAVSLTFHRQAESVLLCHHCAYRRRAPTVCGKCLGPRLRQFGVGTQRVEETVRERFPNANVARLDRDTTTAKNAHTRIISQVASGEIDILIGTQMVTKGFDFPGVTLVGVVTADVALNMPDFRAGERAFQLLTQVSGRAGRGDRPGEVIVQTFNPEHPSIQAASRHDYRGFYGAEIETRQDLGYPPFGALARLLVIDQFDDAARDRIDAATALIQPRAEAAGVEVRGPAPCPLSRLKDRYRWHVLLKAPSPQAITQVLDETWARVQQHVGGVTVDIDPIDLL